MSVPQDPVVLAKAGTGRRLVAFALDVALLSVLLYAAAALLALLTHSGEASLPVPAWHVAATALIGTAYFAASWRLAGATPGQWALGLRVIKAVDRTGPSLARALGRWAALGGPLWLAGSMVTGLVGLLALGGTIVWSGALLRSTLAHADNRGLHDRLSGTSVGRHVRAARAD